MREPGRPGPAVERCPHDSQRMAKVGGHGQGGRAAAGRQRAGCMHDLTQTELAEDRGMELHASRLLHGCMHGRDFCSPYWVHVRSARRRRRRARSRSIARARGARRA